MPRADLSITAVRDPVAPAAPRISSAISVDALVFPDVATSTFSAMPEAGVNVALVAALNAPISRSPAAVVVTVGATMDVVVPEVAPLEASIGRGGVALTSTPE